MNEIPKYKISISALRDYRDGAKKLKNIDIEALKTRINCLIYASENVELILNGKRFRFGNCNFDVDMQGIVKKISWDTEIRKVNKSEADKLIVAYSTVGLNRAGTCFKNNIIC